MLGPLFKKNTKKVTHRYIVIKVPKTKNDDKIFKVARIKRHNIFTKTLSLGSLSNKL